MGGIAFFSLCLFIYCCSCFFFFFFFFFQAEDGIRDTSVTGVQTCALPISCDMPANDAFPWILGGGAAAAAIYFWQRGRKSGAESDHDSAGASTPPAKRSEERRVGKEWRARWGAEQCRKEKRQDNENTHMSE